MTEPTFSELITQFTTAEDIDTLLILTLKYPQHLFTSEAIAALETYRDSLAEDDGRAHMLAQLNDVYHDSRENYYFELFTSVRSRGGMRQLRLLIDEDGLDAIEAQVGKALIFDEKLGEMMEQRLTDLRALREQSIVEVERLHQQEEARLAQANALLPLVEKVENWCNTADWDASEVYLLQHEADLLSDQAAGILFALVSEHGQDETLQRYVLLHKRAREIGITAAYAELRAELSANPADLLAIEDKLIAWVQAPGWPQSEAYLTIHAADLLTDEAEMVLGMLQQKNPNHPALLRHQTLLKACRAEGIDAVYKKRRT